jgi:hypothetical protein
MELSRRAIERLARWLDTSVARQATPYARNSQRSRAAPGGGAHRSARQGAPRSGGEAGLAVARAVGITECPFLAAALHNLSTLLLVVLNSTRLIRFDPGVAR